MMSLYVGLWLIILGELLLTGVDGVGKSVNVYMELTGLAISLIYSEGYVVLVVRLLCIWIGMLKALRCDVLPRSPYSPDVASSVVNSQLVASVEKWISLILKFAFILKIHFPRFVKWWKYDCIVYFVQQLMNGII